MTTIASFLIHDLRVSPHQKPSESQIFTLFILANLGYDLGQTIANRGLGTWHSIHTKQDARRQAITNLRALAARGNLSDVSIEVPDLSVPSALWFNAKNPLEVRWRNPRDGFFYHSHCEVNTLQAQPAVHELVCDRAMYDAPQLGGM